METEHRLLSVRMPVDLLSQIEEAAKREDRTTSNWVRKQIKHALSDDEDVTRREHKRQQADN
jgi:predicted DNA-binding protein